MNYLKNHIYVMAILAFSVVFSAYASQPEPESQPEATTSILRRYRLSMPLLYRSRPIRAQESQEQPSQSAESEKAEPQTNENSNEEPELVNDKLKRKIFSSFSRAAWLEHGNQILDYAMRHWPFLARFFR